MGCYNSKLDELPAVALCRQRCEFLDDAIRKRFALAQTHDDYLQALEAVGISLHRFFEQDLAIGPSSPIDKHQKWKKGGASPHHLHSRSHSGSHLHFHTDSDESDTEALHHDDESSQPHHHPYGGGRDIYGNLAGGGDDGFVGLSYTRKRTTPSVVFAQKPLSLETSRVGEHSDSSSSSYYYYREHDVNHKNEKPPPPPSPPRTSTWDFLNPFETFDNNTYQDPAYNLGHVWKELREEEGIPDLEDENDEAVKEVHRDRKKLVNSQTASSTEPPEALKDSDRVTTNGNLEAGPSAEHEADSIEYKVHKKAIDEENSWKSKGNASGLNPIKGDLDVVRRIKDQFVHASGSGSEVAKFLEVGKLLYKHKKRTIHASTKIFHLPAIYLRPSTPKTSNGDAPDAAFLDVEHSSKSLSSILHELHMWEKKLYEEVKVEEKMRVVHQSKSRKLLYLDKTGAESQKMDATRTLVRSLSTRIKIAFQVVDKISVKINILRDEELWPQINEFIQEFTRMWKSMLDCHHAQRLAVEAAKQLDVIASSQRSTESRFLSLCQLEHDLINWTLVFSQWVAAQRVYVRSLNNWLMKCLLYMPEETPDGIAPFSPGRLEAPPVFVVCNRWSQLLDRISEKEVVESMHDLASNVLHLWDQDKAEMRRKMLESNDEMRIKSMEKEEQRIQKEIEVLEKRIVVNHEADYGTSLTRHAAVYQSETTKGGSLQASLQHVVEAMEKFAGSSLKVYEELLDCISTECYATLQEKKVVRLSL